MMFPRPRGPRSGRPVYRVDLVDTADGLGYETFSPPPVGPVHRQRCPRCGDQDSWAFDGPSGWGSCPCGCAWDALAAARSRLRPAA